MKWFLEEKKRKQIVMWVDKNYCELGYPICNPHELTKTQFDYILIAIESEKIYLEIKKYLCDISIDEKNIFWVPSIFEE